MSSSSMSDDESITEHTPRSNASSSLISSCRKLAAETPPLENVSVGSSVRLSIDSVGAGGRRKTMSKSGNRGVAKSCKMLIGMESEGLERDNETRAFDQGDRDALNKEIAGRYLGLRHFLDRLSSSDERNDMGQETEDPVFAKDSKRHGARLRNTVTDGDYNGNHGELTNSNNGHVKSNHGQNMNGSRTHKVSTSMVAIRSANGSGSLVPQDAQRNRLLAGGENVSRVYMILFYFGADVTTAYILFTHTKKARYLKMMKTSSTERLSSTERKLPSDYEDRLDQEYMTLPASTHTLMHTEPINSVAFLFSLGIAVLSASCLLLVLVNEMSKGQKGNLLDVPTGVSSGVRGAQFCGIFVGLLMEEEIPQGLILLRVISRASFHETYPQLSFTRFVLSCLVRLMMGNLFLLNLLVTIVQADDVITIFFDILALEFVQHLDDVAFELGKRDMLGRSLYEAASVEYKVLTREGMKRIRDAHDEEKSLMPQHHHQQQESIVAKKSFFCCRRRSEKKVHLRWILKAEYFINLACLLAGTIIVGQNQKNGNYHCKSVSVMFGDQVWEDAYVRNRTDPSQVPHRETLVYSYFNGVYKITGTDPLGYPIYTEMNKITGEAYVETVGAEIVYCQSEEAWVFRHELISKVDISRDDEDECLQWLLRSPESKAFDITDVPHEDWSVWTGVITPGNKVSVLCNVCKHNSDCNYHGECGKNGECYCKPGFYGLHCEFEEFCEKLIDDEGEIFSLVTDTANRTLLSYMRPIYASRSLNLLEIAASGNASARVSYLVNNSIGYNNYTDGDLLPAEGETSDNSTYIQASTSPTTSCYPGAEKVRLDSTTGEQIAMFEFQVYSSGTNVALQGTATQSSDRYNGVILDAYKAIDGVNTTFSHTNDSNATWEVDLGGLYPIESVVILNRNCGNSLADPLGCLCRLSNVSLTLLDETESIVAVKTIGNTCGQFTVAESFTPSYACRHALSNSSTLADAKNVTDLINEETSETVGNSTLIETLDKVISGVGLWGTLVLVYSGSRWFGTMEFSNQEEFKSSTLIYNAEYHAFWDKLYEGKTFFISDPTSGATPVGADFYENEAFGNPQWDDYGPFGLLTPLNNITGKGYFHCMGTNISAVKVASGTGAYGE